MSATRKPGAFARDGGPYQDSLALSLDRVHEGNKQAFAQLGPHRTDTEAPGTAHHHSLDDLLEMPARGCSCKHVAVEGVP